MRDTDRDAIPDSVDVSFTLGSDDDNDGIDDRYDASILLANDQDNDGIADAWDPDADGDGWADTIVKGIQFQRALPDENNNGVADIIEPSSGKILTGLQGHGGCVLNPNSRTSDPLLPTLVLLSAMMAGRCRRRPGNTQRQ